VCFVVVKGVKICQKNVILSSNCRKLVIFSRASAEKHATYSVRMDHSAQPKSFVNTHRRGFLEHQTVNDRKVKEFFKFFKFYNYVDFVLCRDSQPSLNSFLNIKALNPSSFYYYLYYYYYCCLRCQCRLRLHLHLTYSDHKQRVKKIGKDKGWKNNKRKIASFSFKYESSFLIYLFLCWNMCNSLNIEINRGIYLNVNNVSNISVKCRNVTCLKCLKSIKIRYVLFIIETKCFCVCIIFSGESSGRRWIGKFGQGQGQGQKGTQMSNIECGLYAEEWRQPLNMTKDMEMIGTFLKTGVMPYLIERKKTTYHIETLLFILFNYVDSYIVILGFSFLNYLIGKTTDWSIVFCRSSILSILMVYKCLVPFLVFCVDYVEYFQFFEHYKFCLYRIVTQHLHELIVNIQNEQTYVGFVCNVHLSVLSILIPFYKLLSLFSLFSLSLFGKERSLEIKSHEANFW
jgi:hypothetical protein